MYGGLHDMLTVKSDGYRNKNNAAYKILVEKMKVLISVQVGQAYARKSINLSLPIEDK